MDDFINYLWPHSMRWGTRSGSIGDPLRVAGGLDTIDDQQGFPIEAQGAGGLEQQ